MAGKTNVRKVRKYITDALAFWKVPGAAVAVVEGGEVILCEGFGLRDVRNKLPVTPDTLFPIASASKAFTAMGVALQVDAGRAEWDKPVRDYLPSFKLSDPIIADRITPRDLLCHRSGLPRHDFLWYASNFSRQEVLDRLRYLEFSRDLRTTFQYQNMMFMAAGVLAAHLDGNGKSWEAYTKARILDPLGMHRTNFSTVETQADADHAEPYRKKKNKVMPTTYFEADNDKDAVGPAGSICSSARDLSQWLLMHLNGGKHNDDALASPSSIIQMHTPHMLMGDYGYDSQMGLRFGSYGLGWFIHSLNGRKVVHHGGNLDGFSSMVSMMPDEGTGVAILTNLEGTFARDVLGIALHELLLGAQSLDWNARFRAIADEFETAEASGKTKSATDRKRNAPPSHRLEDYAGDYEHPGYGMMTVRLRGKKLELVTNDKFTLPMSHYHYDVFEAYFEKFDYRLKLSFSADVKGNVASLSAQMEPEVKDIVFTKLPPKQVVPADVLARLAGDYELVGMLVSVTVSDEMLTLTMPGQPVYALLPYKELEFQIKGRAGYSVQFKLGKRGPASALVFSDASASYTAKRK